MARRDEATTAELSPPAPDISDQPRLIVAGGRGKVGKSVMLRFGIERCIARGGDPIIADADRTNATLTAFFPSAVRPPSPEDGDVRDWLNSLIDAQVEHRKSIFLDLGGGDLSLHAWARDLDLVPFLIDNGIIPVLIHCLGSDLDDLAYLRDLEDVFAPPHTVILLNEGLIPIGKAPLTAFEPTLAHEVFRAAKARGAVVVRLPRLGCMQELERRRLTVQAAIDNDVGTGQPFGITGRQMIVMWRRQAEKALAPVLPWIS